MIIDGFPYKTNKELFKAVQAFSKKIHCDINPQTDVDKFVNEMLTPNQAALFPQRRKL